MDKEAVTLDRNHVIQGRIHFANGFDVDEHLFVNGTVDGVRVEELCRSVVRKNNFQIITGPTQVTGNLVIKGPLTVNGSLNGITSLEAFAKSVLKVDEPGVLTGVNRFRELVLNGPVLSSKLFAGFRIDEIFANYMSLSRDQVVNSQMAFHNDLQFDGKLFIKGNLVTLNATINNVNLHRLNATVLRIYGDQVITGDYTFESQVKFDNRLNVVNKIINGLHLINDLMMKGRDNVVNAPKVFVQDIVVFNDLNISHGKTIAGVDISEMARHAVMRNKGQQFRIGGNKYFDSLEVDHLKVKRINGVEISAGNLLLTYGNQVIHGLKVLNNGLNTESEITSRTINHINIRNLSQSLVLKGHNNSIYAVKTFAAPLTVHNVLTYGRVDGVDLNELNYFIGLPVNLGDLKLRLDHEDHKIASLQMALDRQAIELEFYELVSTIHSGPPLHLLFNHLTQSQHLFVAGEHLANGCQEVNVFANVNNKWIFAKKLFAIEANLMISFTWNLDQFIVISNSKRALNPEQCLRMNGQTSVAHYGSGPVITQILKFDTKINDYKHIAVLNSEMVTDIKVIQDSGHRPCLVMAIPVSNGRLGHSMVVCIGADRKFYLTETTPLLGMDQVFKSFSCAFLRLEEDYITSLCPPSQPHLQSQRASA